MNPETPGVASIYHLLTLTKKADAAKYAKEMEVNVRDFSWFIRCCPALKYSHFIKTRRFVPPNVGPNKQDVANLGTGDGVAFVKKVSQLVNEEKYVVAHGFLDAYGWHIFYFSNRDTARRPGSHPHWRFGSHIHFVNHLWPELDFKKVWDAFNQRSCEVSSPLHIRFTGNRLPT